MISIPISPNVFIGTVNIFVKYAKQKKLLEKLGIVIFEHASFSDLTGSIFTLKLQEIYTLIHGIKAVH